MPAARHMPRTRTALLARSFAVLFTIAGLLGTGLSAFDLFDGKDALIELVVSAAILVVGIGGQVLVKKILKPSIARDWATLPPEVPRDLPYGAEARDREIEFPTKLSAVVFLLILGIGFTALGVYGFLIEDTGAVAIAVSMGVIAAAFFGLAWMIHGVRWVADDNGVTRHVWPKSTIDWASVAEYHTNPRGNFVALTGPNRAKPRVAISCSLLEISSVELINTLKNRQAQQGATPDRTG